MLEYFDALGLRASFTFFFSILYFSPFFFFFFLLGGVNQVTYPEHAGVLRHLGVPIEPSDMSFSVSRPQCEWGSTGLSGLLAHRRNACAPPSGGCWGRCCSLKGRPKYLKTVEGVVPRGPSPWGFLGAHGYSTLFRDCYLVQ